MEIHSVVTNYNNHYYCLPLKKYNKIIFRRLSERGLSTWIFFYTFCFWNPIKVTSEGNSVQGKAAPSQQGTALIM